MFSTDYQTDATHDDLEVILEHSGVDDELTRHVQSRVNFLQLS